MLIDIPEVCKREYEVIIKNIPADSFVNSVKNGLSEGIFTNETKRCPITYVTTNEIVEKKQIDKNSLIFSLL